MKSNCKIGIKRNTRMFTLSESGMDVLAKVMHLRSDTCFSSKRAAR